MFWFLIMLTIVDPKENGYQNPHLLFLMQVRVPTKRERIGALVVVAWTRRTHILMQRYQGILVGLPPCFGGLELVTISKLLFLCTCLFIYDIFQHVHVLFIFVLQVINTSLNVIFIKTCVYTCTSSEQQIDSYMFALHCLFVLTICTCIAQF